MNERSPSRAVWVLPRRGERTTVALAALGFFGVMLWYFPLRSLRDALAAERGVRDLPWLFTGTWLGMLAINPPFAWLVARLSRRVSLGLVFHLAAACLLGFYFLLGHPERFAARASGAVFYVWLSVFNLFTISIAWAIFSECFSLEQGKRCFGWVGLGGTLGAIAGSQWAESWAHSGRDPLRLLLSSALMIELFWPVLAWIVRHPLRSDTEATPAAREAALGGGVLEGLRLTLRTPVLFLVALFLLSQTAGSAFLYSEQQSLVASELPDRAARTAWLARTERWGQIVTLGAQLLLTAPLLSWLGIGFALLLYPLGSMFLFTWLATSPGLAAVFAARVGARGLDAASSRPAREALFTLASRAGRFKAKPFLDTFVYRSGDVAGSWLFRAGHETLQLSLSGLALFATALGAVGVGLAVLLGRRIRESEAARPAQHRTL
jgi:AAA family ATP:ADP antiporter